MLTRVQWSKAPASSVNTKTPSGVWLAARLTELTSYQQQQQLADITSPNSTGSRFLHIALLKIKKSM